MKDLHYYKINLAFSFVTTILLVIILQLLAGIWLTTHIFLTFAFLLIITIGMYGLANKKDWAPIVFLLLFASQAIDGFYLLAISQNGVVYAYVLISIIALYKTAANADIYQKLRKEAFFKVQTVPTKKKTSKKKKSSKKKSKK